MSQSFCIHPDKSALLVMDFQNAIVDNYLSADQAGALLAKTAELIGAARKARMQVIYVMVAFRPGHPEVSPNNRLFAAVKERGLFVRGRADTDIHAAVAPAGDEPVVIKHRIGRFPARTWMRCCRQGASKLWCWRASRPRAWCCRRSGRPSTGITA